MTSNARSFTDVLEAESQIDVARLMDMAEYGVPSHLRAQVWKYLLGVAEDDRSNEATMSRSRKLEYAEMIKNDPESARLVARCIGRLRHDASAYAAFAKKETRNKLENILVAYANYHPGFSFTQGHLHMIAPLYDVLRSETDAYFCFSAILLKLDAFMARKPLQRRMSEFMGYFRSMLPDLYSHFEEEEVLALSWSTSWLRYLLAAELPARALLRLWDTYFSRPGGLELHPFVCVAILSTLADDFLEIDADAIVAYLRRLPTIDMDVVIALAKNFERQMH